MEKDLKLHGLQYNIAVSMFFVPYGLFDVPSNIVLKMIKPSRWIAVLMFSWGVVMTLMGLVSSAKGLYITRFFLGVTESGFFPASTFLLTLWYRRYEVQSRMAVFYASASLSGAFSGLLAYGIETMDGIDNLGGWQWIFVRQKTCQVVEVDAHSSNRSLKASYRLHSLSSFGSSSPTHPKPHASLRRTKRSSSSTDSLSRPVPATAE